MPKIVNAKPNRLWTPVHISMDSSCSIFATIIFPEIGNSINSINNAIETTTRLLNDFLLLDFMLK